MDSPFAGATDPTPYIAACYLIGTILLVGFYAYTIAERQKLRTLLAAVRHGDKSRNV